MAKTRQDASPEDRDDERWPLGVFTSVDAGFGVRLEIAHELGVPTMHLHAPHVIPTGEDTRRLSEKLEDLRITATVVFAGFDGESYADIPTVERTVGLVPSETRPRRVEKLKEIIQFTADLNVDATGLHLGFVPHEADAPDGFDSIVQTTQHICKFANELGVNIHLETGQETADGLLAFLDAVQQDNLFVNFDPANMILYGCGEPIPALHRLGRYVRSVHCKDAKWSAEPGESWGQEVMLGTGHVNFVDFLSTLEAIGYRGPLTIEREISQEPVRQKEEISRALQFLTQLKGNRK